MSADPTLSNSKGDERIIAVQKLSIYGFDSPPARSPSTCVKAASFPPGDTHTVSVRLAAKLTNFSLGLLLNWASTGDCFCKLEWIFPSYKFPKFTTRHVLVQEGTDDVSFSGGLNWAIKILEYFHPPEDVLDDEDTQFSPTESHFAHQQPQQILPYERPHQACTESPVETTYDAADCVCLPGVTSALPETLPSAPSLPLRYGKPPVYTQPEFLISQQMDMDASIPSSPKMFPDFAGQSTAIQTSLGCEIGDNYTDEDEDLRSSMSLTTATTRQSSPECLNSTPYGNSRQNFNAEERDRIEALSHQRQEAASQYARNGDSTSTFAVLDSAAQFRWAWDSSGFARF